MNRKDIDTKKYCSSTSFYRGGGLTDAEIKEYSDCIGGNITFFGYTSFSLVESKALEFAWQDKSHEKVLFHLVWNAPNQHYYLNAGAYDHEEEIVLMDGAWSIVESVESIKDSNNEHLYTLIKLLRINN